MTEEEEWLEVETAVALLATMGYTKRQFEGIVNNSELSDSDKRRVLTENLSRFRSEDETII